MIVYMLPVFHSYHHYLINNMIINASLLTSLDLELQWSRLLSHTPNKQKHYKCERGCCQY
jgi:hypothetical protein